MQFMPATWARWGHGDVHDPRHAIFGAARYLAASGAADGRVDDAVFAYNRDNRYVRAVNLYAGLLEHPLLFRVSTAGRCTTGRSPATCSCRWATWRSRRARP